MKPKISIIVPIYNTAQYLDKCLVSILNQTIQEIEIICVDDCSPDDSYLIVEKYVEQDSRVSLIRHKINKGSGGARNTGILAAKADYLGSVDSDDYIKPTMMETLWNSTENGKFDVVGCGYDYIDENETIISSHNFHPKVFHNDKKINIFSIVNPAFWNKLWKKSLFIENDIYFPEKLYYQDLATIPRLLSKAKNVKLIAGNYYNYLLRSESTTTSYSQKHLANYFEVFNLLLEFLKANQLFDDHKDAYINTIDANIYYHAKNILKSDLNEKEQVTYLLQLYEEKKLFLEQNCNIHRLSYDSVKGISKKNSNKNKIVYLLSPYYQLSLQQKIASRVAGLFLKGFLSPHQQIKLRENPVGFFNDSKSSITRSIGSFLKVI